MLVAITTLSAAAQSVPAGWKIVKDRKQHCQIAVPADWTTDKILTSQATAPDKSASALVHGIPPGAATYADTVKAAKGLYKPIKTFEESGSRTWYSTAPDPGQTGTSWYVATGGAQVCDAQILFKTPASEATAKQIVMSLTPVK